MALTQNDQTTIRGYLLGRLSDEEQQKIEERLLVDDELFAELEISKGELIDEYCAGELSQNDHNWFERHYLASNEGSQRHAFTVALGSLKRPTQAAQSAGVLESIGAYLRQRPWVIGLATAGVLLVVLVGLFVRSTRPQNSLAVTLANSTIKRSANENRYHKIALKSDIGDLRLSLTLPESAKHAAKYRAELDNRSEIRSLTPTGHDGNSVLVIIPADHVPPGLYALTLYTVQTDGSEQAVPGQYFFEVERTN